MVIKESFDLVETKLARVEVRGVRRLEQQVNSIFGQHISQIHLGKSAVMKRTVIHDDCVTPLEYNRSIPPGDVNSILKK